MHLLFSRPKTFIVASKKQISFFVLLFIPFWLSAQDYNHKSLNDSTIHSISIQGHWGIVLPHHAAMAYLIDDYSHGSEIKYTQQNLKSTSWQRFFNYPETGIALFYNTFGNHEIYGEGIALYPFINFRLYNYKQFSLTSKVALGMAYATQPFDAQMNSYNTVFSSHFNAFVGFGLNATLPLSTHWIATSSFNLNHISNGSTKKPNNGINTATMALGIGYRFNNEIIKTPLKQPAPSSNEKEILLQAGIGRNQVVAYNSKKFWSGSISATHLWYTKTTQAFGVGLDMICYGGAPYAYNEFEDLDENATYGVKDYLYSSLFGTYQLQMSRTTMFFNLGVYIYKPTEPRQPIYPKVGIRYRITDRLLGSFGIKANFFAAEYLEFGLGYRFTYK